MIIVTLTYVTLVMRADNDGEGGIMALITLLRRLGVPTRPTHRDDAGRARDLRRRAVLRRQHDHPGDLGAVRGRGPQGRRPRSSTIWIVPITAVIIVVLFAVQRLGTARGRPALRAGDDRLVPRRSARAASTASPSIPRSCRRCRRPTRSSSSSATSTSRSSRWPRSCSPSPAPRRSTPTWATSAARPITLGWLGLVLPACMLNYFGQGALILGDRDRGQRTRSSCSARTGRASRWCCWRPRRR